MFFLLPILLAAPLMAQTVKEEKVYGRDAWVLENGLIRVALLKGGGHIAEVRLLSSVSKANVNPMRVPHYPTIDPHSYDPAVHDATYGADPHRWLSSGYMGHLLCFPFYGPPSSPDEVAARLGNHGEAPIVEWHRTKVQETEAGLLFTYAAWLPRTQYRVERTVTLAKGARHVRVEEWVENVAAFDRPFQWMQHATFGPPFIEPGKTLLDTSATRGMVANEEVAWPGENGKLRPMTATERSGGYVPLQMDPARRSQFFTLHNPGLKLLIGYVFPTAQNPWLADWQENKRNTHKPWNNQVIARGLEFGNSPYAEGLRKAIDRGKLFGVPAYGWIGAKQKLKNEFIIFLAEVPEGFPGVRDVQLNQGVPVFTAK
ncbi:MAG: DUF4432 family protein [Bryobacterales bacterium]|nr:DUF4432 family protein [Bryobacterales bacterium]